MIKEEKLNKSIRLILILAISFCCLLLFPQIRNFIVIITEIILGRDLNNSIWLRHILYYSSILMTVLFLILPSTIKNIKNLYDRYKNTMENIFIYASIVNVLRNFGTLTEVMNVYDTPLYYFERRSQ